MDIDGDMVEIGDVETRYKKPKFKLDLPMNTLKRLKNEDGEGLNRSRSRQAGAIKQK